MAMGRLRPRTGPAREPGGSLGEHHAFLCQLHLDRIDQIDRDIDTLTQRNHQAVAPSREHIARLSTIPGIDTRAAEEIVAETGGDMSRFRTPAQLASWAGVAPTTTSPGDAATRQDHQRRPVAKDALGEAALAALRTQHTDRAAQHRRRVRRGGNKQKAIVALEHSILNSAGSCSATTPTTTTRADNVHDWTPVVATAAQRIMNRRL